MPVFLMPTILLRKALNLVRHSWAGQHQLILIIGIMGAITAVLILVHKLAAHSLMMESGAFMKAALHLF